MGVQLEGTEGKTATDFHPIPVGGHPAAYSLLLIMGGTHLLQVYEPEGPCCSRQHLYELFFNINPQLRCVRNSATCHRFHEHT
jgi:hypothetical protein